jgi:hypothetical protein
VGYSNEIVKRRKLGSEVWMLDVVAGLHAPVSGGGRRERALRALADVSRMIPAVESGRNWKY